MNKKSFFLGVVTGIVVMLVGLFVVNLISRKSGDGASVEKSVQAEKSNAEEKNDAVKYLDQPVSYENKKETSFKVLQVFNDAALAMEVSDEDHDMYFGNTVVIIGENYYSEQIVEVKNPQRVGTYSYTSNGGMPMTVPIIDGEMK